MWDSACDGNGEEEKEEPLGFFCCGLVRETTPRRAVTAERRRFVTCKRKLPPCGNRTNGAGVWRRLEEAEDDVVLGTVAEKSCCAGSIITGKLSWLCSTGI